MTPKQFTLLKRQVDAQGERIAAIEKKLAPKPKPKAKAKKK